MLSCVYVKNMDESRPRIYMFDAGLPLTSTVYQVPGDFQSNRSVAKEDLRNHVLTRIFFLEGLAGDQRIAKPAGAAACNRQNASCLISADLVVAVLRDCTMSSLCCTLSCMLYYMPCY